MFKKKDLDYLAIPDSGGTTKKEREKRALKEVEKRRIKKVILLTGKDSEEDIIMLGKIVKKDERIGFDTFPLHYKEYKQLIKKAKRDGKFPKGIKVENIKTNQNLKQTLYGYFGLYEEKIKDRKLSNREYRDESLLQSLKGIIKKFIEM